MDHKGQNSTFLINYNYLLARQLIEHDV